MPISSGPATRTRSYSLRLQTTGEGSGSTLWPPLSDGSTPFAGTPVGVRFPFSRLRPRHNRSPLVQTIVLTAGSPIFYGGPGSRLRPRMMRGPSNTETAGPITDITSISCVLNGQTAIVSAAGQQDIYDIGNDTAYLTSQYNTMTATSVSSVIGVAVISSQNSSMLGQGSVFLAGQIVGTGLFTPQNASLVSNGVQDIIGQAVLIAPSSSMVASGQGTTFAYGPDEVWRVLIEGQYEAIHLLRIIAAAVAGDQTGAKDAPQFKAVDKSKVRITGAADDSGARVGILDVT